MNHNPVTWIAWGLAALYAAFVGRSPLLQALLLLVLLNVWLASRGQRAFPIRTALILAILPVLFSVALSRFGRG